jgi:hypothetical protein
MDGDPSKVKVVKNSRLNVSHELATTRVEVKITDLEPMKEFLSASMSFRHCLDTYGPMMCQIERDRWESAMDALQDDTE